LISPQNGIAVSLLSIESTSLNEGELLTLSFDEDALLSLSGSASSLLVITSQSVLHNDALSLNSVYISTIDQNGNSLKFHCSMPVFAELRRAGAGNYLLFVRPTEQPDTSSPDQNQSSNTDSVIPSFDPDLEKQSSAEMLTLARLHAMQDRFEDARETVSQIPEESEEYAWGQLVLGDIESQQGNDSAALNHYEEALKHEHTEAAAATNLALYHQHKGNSGKSQQMWERVLSLNDAGVSPLDDGSDQTGEDAVSSARNNQSSSDNERTGSKLDFDSNEPVEFFNSGLIIGVALFLFIGGGVATGFVFWQNKQRSKKKKADDSSAEEDDVFWDSDEVTSGGAGSLAEELEHKKNGAEETSDQESEMDVSEETRKRLVEMHNQKNSIREMAEITGMSQDIIRMALQMEGVSLQD